MDLLFGKSLLFLFAADIYGRTDKDERPVGFLVGRVVMAIVKTGGGKDTVFVILLLTNCPPIRKQ